MRRAAAAGLLLALAAFAAAQDAAPGAPPPSPFYLERGTAPRPPGALDPVPDTALRLALLTRDGAVPGFYDGQFASVADRFDELARLASDADVNHVVRIMAVMALQEAGSGPAVAAVLEPLVLRAQDEVTRDQEAWDAGGTTDDPEFIGRLLEAGLSQYARFALAKDGQPRLVLEKIREMENRIHRFLPEVLDPSIDSERIPRVAWRRQVVFDIGYHYQQFDDFEHATEWFRKLTDNLPGRRETRWAHYNLACIAALQGRPEEAMGQLEAAWQAGFADLAWLMEDGDLAGLRERADFRALVERMRGGAREPAAGDGEGP